MLDAPSLRDLHVFLEVCHTRSLSRAAERLGLAQPSVSAAMQRLERNLGTTLLERSKAGVTPTAAGLRLQAHAQPLCEAWIRTKDRVLAARHEVAGGFVLGCHTAVAGYALGFLPHFLGQYPRLNLTLRHDLSRRLLEAVLSMRCDMGLVINARRHPDLVLKRMCRDEVTLFQAANTPPMPNVLICDPSLYQTQDILRTLQRRKQGFTRILDTSSLEVAARLTAIGVGVGILPRNMAAPLGLQALAHAPTYHDELFFVYRAENKQVPAIRALSRALREWFQGAEARTGQE